MEKPPSITCPFCGLTSYNPNDVKQRYCGRCHVFLDDVRLFETLIKSANHDTVKQPGRDFGNPDFLFVAGSGAICAGYLETKGSRYAVRVRWGMKPTEEDQSEADAFFVVALERAGVKLGEVVEARHGSGAGAAARGAEAIRRYLKTGEPGCVTKKLR
jgi:hypothetical protein